MILLFFYKQINYLLPDIYHFGNKKPLLFLLERFLYPVNALTFFTRQSIIQVHSSILYPAGGLIIFDICEECLESSPARQHFALVFMISMITWLDSRELPVLIIRTTQSLHMLKACR